MSISKIFIPYFVCVLTNERYKTYQTGCLFCRLGHVPGVGLWGTGGTQGVKQFFFQTWSCSISNRRRWRAEQNASNIFILGSNWWPWGEVKRSNIINMSISKIFIPNFVGVLTNKRYKTYWTEFSFCCQGHAPGWEFGVLGESKTLVWGFAMAPHRLRALVTFLVCHCFQLKWPERQLKLNLLCPIGRLVELSSLCSGLHFWGVAIHVQHVHFSSHILVFCEYITSWNIVNWGII